MQIALVDIFYNASMLILAVIGALVITKTISRYLPKERDKKDEEKE